MLQFTRAAITKTIWDLKKIVKTITYSLQLFTITYLIYSLVFNVGNRYINGVLLAIACLYFLYTLCIKNQKALSSQTKVTVRRIITWSKIAIKTFTLGTTLYGFYFATTAQNPLTVILTTLMLITWILQVLFEAVVILFEKEKIMFEKALAADLERFQIIDKIKNAINHQPPQDPSPVINTLNKVIEQKKENKVHAKAKKAELKIEKKKNKALQKLQAKINKNAAKKNDV